MRPLTCSPSALHHVIGVIVPVRLAFLRVVVFEREVGFVRLEVRLCELCPEGLGAAIVRSDAVHPDADSG